jgi:hypothetical protein
MKFLKQTLPEPDKLPDKESKEILIEDYNWHPLMIHTFRGSSACLNIAFAKLKRSIWEELTK